MRSLFINFLLTGVLVSAANTSVRGAVIRVVPVRADVGHTIDGQTITLDEVPARVQVDVLISDFADQVVAAYQVSLDCPSLVSNVQGSALAINTDCTIGGGVFGTDYCLGVDTNRDNFLLANAASVIPACQNTVICPTGDPGAFACGGVSIFGDSGPDNGGEYYGTEFGFDITSDMLGEIAISIAADPNLTFIKDQLSRDVPVDDVIPAVVALPVGACCGAGGSLDCQDALTQSACESAGGDWFSGMSCSGVEGGTPGVDSICPACTGEPGDTTCDDGNACTVDTCDNGTCINEDNTPAGSCCNPQDGGLTTIDDGDPCTDDVCDPATGEVSYMSAAMGTVCDDGNGCTGLDGCDGMGMCVGTDINTIECNDMGDCPFGAQSCTDGFCVCEAESRLELVVLPSMQANENCFQAGETVSVNVEVTGTSDCVVGAQLTVDYDPDCLVYDGLTTSADYPLLLFSDVNEFAGEITVAAGINPGESCHNGVTTLVTLNFSKTDACDRCDLSFIRGDQRGPIVSNEVGNRVPLEIVDSKEIDLAGDLTINSPEGVTEINPNCDSANATVTWGPITVEDSCGDATELTCTVTHSDGLELDYLLEAGGVFPRGTTSFSCTVTNDCGMEKTNEWSVVVSDQHVLDVEIQLGGVIVGDPIMRCICFQLYRDCVSEPSTVCREFSFGGPFDFPGHWRGELKVPKGQYACITAKDPLHSLRSAAAIDCVDNVLMAQFKGDPIFDGNWLMNGNLDSWKPDGRADTIEILDFAMLASQFGDEMDPNTMCDTQGPHADINGDGIVDNADFSFLDHNYAASSVNACCPATSSAQTELPRMTMSVRDLVSAGLRDAERADLNRDGVVNLDDIEAFRQGRTTTSRRNLRKFAD